MTELRGIRHMGRFAALTAPLVVSGWLGAAATGNAAESARARPVRVSPGRAVFEMTPSGAWTSFGLKQQAPLVSRGGVVVFGTDSRGGLVERFNAADGGGKSLFPAGGVARVQEGVPGGARAPSFRPDDDGDGRVDEDPLDRIDNDGDGRVDEDFAAIGDEMAVAIYGPADRTPLSIRQEVYAWSLAHIDAMVASSVTVKNTGDTPLPGVRVGYVVTAGDELEAGRVLARASVRRVGDLAGTQVTVDGRDVGLALLAFSPARSDDDWECLDDGERILLRSPDLGSLRPGATVTFHLALVGLPERDDHRSRVIQTAQRTVLGDQTVRMIPPPSLKTRPSDEPGGPPEAMAPVTDGTPALDPFWLTPGRLDESLIVGSPNPFRDALTVEYEVPSRTVDEDGVEHTLSGAAVPTSVKVYNVTGRLVATLVESVHGPGVYRTGWSAQTDEGAVVASGVYYVKLQVGKRSVTKRLVQLK